MVVTAGLLLVEGILSLTLRIWYRAHLPGTTAVLLAAVGLMRRELGLVEDQVDQLQAVLLVPLARRVPFPVAALARLAAVV